jgi:hypothetical protein
MDDFIRYIPFILTAVLGIGGIVFNTKKDPDNPSKLFNKPTSTGYLAMAFILVAFLFAIYLFQKDNQNKDEQKITEKNYRDTTRKLLDSTVAAQTRALLSAKSHSDLLTENLVRSQHQADTLGMQNSALMKSLEEQMTVAYFSVLNQTVIQPNAIIVIESYKSLEPGQQEKEENDEAINDSRYISKRAREFISPEFSKIVDKTPIILSGHTSSPFIIGSLRLRMGAWDCWAHLLSDGTVMQGSLPFTKKLKLPAESGEQEKEEGDKYDNASIEDSMMIFEWKERSGANTAELYNKLTISERLIQFEYSYDLSVPDTYIRKKTEQLNKSIKRLVLLIPVNLNSSLGFICHMVFDKLEIQKDKYRKTSTITWIFK